MPDFEKLSIGFGRAERGGSLEPDAGGGSPGGGAADREIVVFYCHSCSRKLNAPVRMAGKAGQCPHCGAKFHIPSPEDAAADESPTETQEEKGIRNRPAHDVIEMDDVEEVEEFPVEETEDFAGSEEFSDAPGEPGPRTPPPPRPMPAAGHALAHVLMQLWTARGEEAQLELYLKEGELLTPEFFSAELSQLGYGVFANRDEDGTYQVFSVPWDSVGKAVLKKMDRLPDGLFE